MVRFYRERGAAATQELLAKRGYHRSKHAITDRANRTGMNVEPGRKKKVVPLVDAHWRQLASGTRLAHRAIVAAAERDGVMTRSLVYPFTRYAPQWWVDQYMEVLSAWEEAEAEIVRTWLTTAEVAWLFGARARSVASLVSPKRGRKIGPLYQAVRRITTLQFVTNRGTTMTLTRYWKPADAYREAAAYRALRNARRTRQRASSNGVIQRRAA
jgi:hypothetical protein